MGKDPKDKQANKDWAIHPKFGGTSASPVADGAAHGKVTPGEITTVPTYDPERYPLGKPVVLIKPPNDTLYGFMSESAMTLAGSTGAANLNKWGTVIQGIVNQVGEQELEWSKEFAAFKKDAEQGKEELKKVQAAGNAMSESMRKPGGDKLQAAIVAYRKGEREARTKLLAIARQLVKVDVAFASIDIEKLKQRATAEQRDVNKKDGEVKEEEKNIQEQKEHIREIFSIAAHVIHPGKWETIIGAYALVGLEKALEDNVSTARLEKLQKELTAATTQLEGTQDEIALKQIANAMKTWKMEVDTLDQMREDFDHFAPELRLADTNLRAELQKSSATRPVTAVIEKRSKLFKEAAGARTLMDSYLNHTKDAPRRLKQLEDNYRNYKTMVMKSNDLSEPYRKTLGHVADHNATALVEFRQRIDAVRALAQQNLVYLSKDDVYAGYDKIPDTMMQQAIDRKVTPP